MPLVPGERQQSHRGANLLQCPGWGFRAETPKHHKPPRDTEAPCGLSFWARVGAFRRGAVDFAVAYASLGCIADPLGNYPPLADADVL